MQHPFKGLILEGSDCVGKTTLAESRPSLWGCVHSSKPDPSCLWPDWFMTRAVMNPYCVFDRLQLGGLVYGHLLGLHSVGHLTVGDFCYYTLQLRRQHSIPTVVLYFSNESEYRTIMESQQKRDEMFDIRIREQANRLYGGLDFVPRWDISERGYPEWKTLVSFVNEWSS